jgi:hypothetical protein
MKRLYFEKQKPEQIHGCPISGDTYPNAVRLIIDAFENERIQYNQQLKESVNELDEMCNNFDKLISTTNDLPELLQAILDSKTVLKFYEEFDEPCLKNGIERLTFILNKGEVRKEILNSENVESEIVRPKLNCPLNDEELKSVYKILVTSNKVEKDKEDLWLFWFGRNSSLKKPEKIIWEGYKQDLSNIMQCLCLGNKDRRAIFDAFYHLKVKTEKDLPEPKKLVFMKQPLFERINKYMVIYKFLKK